MTVVTIHYLPGARNDATRLAARLGISAYEISLHRFPDDELRVTVGSPAATTLIYSSLDRPNEKLLALLFACEALRREGARRLVLVAPYMCYMRQDTAFEKGQAVSQRAVGQLLSENFDRIITVDAHLHRTANIHAIFPRIEADNLSATPAIADAMRSAGYDHKTIVVGPDAESLPWVSDLANRLNLDFAVARKVRRGDQTVDIAFPNEGIFAGRPVLVVDDIVSSGGTLSACARALVAEGASNLNAIVVHALFGEQLVGDLKRAGIQTVRSTTSVPHPTNAIPLDSIFTEALRSELQGAEQ
jgi:ribose-phosphate pyrophosphokinase